MFDRSSRFLAAVALCGLMLAGPDALAQQSPATSSPAPAAPVPPSVTLPTLPVAPAEPSPASVALAREVIVASGLTRSFDIIVPQFLDQIGTTVTRTRPDLIRDLNAVLEGIKPEFDKQTEDVVTGIARIYAQRLNDKQLREIGDFFKGPAGQAYVAAQPLVMNDIVAQVQGFTQRLSGEMMTRVRAEMRKRGHEL